jgi:hypothetical protein
MLFKPFGSTNPPQISANKNGGKQEGKYQRRKHYTQPAGRSKGKESDGEK